MEFVKLKMIVKNLDNKQSFLFSKLVARVRRKRRKRCYRGARNCGSEVHIQKGLYLLCSPISDCHAARRYIFFFFVPFFFFFYSRNRFRKKKKALLLSWVEFCGLSIVSFRYRVQEQLLFQRLMACHSLPKERLDHPVILNERYTRTFIHVFVTLNRSTFNKVFMYPGLFWSEIPYS